MNAPRVFIITIFTLILLKTTASAQYYPMQAPVSEKKNADLRFRLKNSKPDTNRVKLQLSLCNLYFNKPFKLKKDINIAMAFARNAEVLSTKIGYTRGLNDALFYEADILTLRNDLSGAGKMLNRVNDTTKVNMLLLLGYRWRIREGEHKVEDQDRALNYAHEAALLSQQLHLKEKEIHAANLTATIHADRATPNAETELLDVIKRYRAIGYKNLHYVYFQLTQLKYNRGENEKSLYYSTEGIKSMKSTGDSLFAGDLYLVHAISYRQIKEYQKSIEYAKMAIEKYKVHPGEGSIYLGAAIVSQNLQKEKKYQMALALLKNMLNTYPPEEGNTQGFALIGVIGNIYRDLKAYDQAERYFIKFFNVMKKEHTLLYSNYLNLGQLYVESGKYEKARPFLAKVLSYPYGFIPLPTLKHVHYLSFLTDSATHHYLSAIGHYTLYNHVGDSVLKQTREKEIQKLVIQFETEKKENEISAKNQNIRLLTQQYQLQQVKLKHANDIQNATIGGTFLLVVILGLLYQQYRNKQRSSQLVTEKNQLITKKNELITRKNETLEHLLREKDWLLKEVHHRVKNNLHTVICLLESQASYLENDALKAIENSQHRIYAMSLIHQKLYQSDDIKTIDMDLYLPEFVQYLSDSFDAGGKIHFRLDIEPLQIALSQAIPLALIINEAITNSIKYAFPENRKGQITIHMYKIEKEITLILKDNGIGIRQPAGDGNTSSLGMDLMMGLSTEINARINFHNDSGAVITIIFEQDLLLEQKNALFIPLEEEV